MEKQTLKGLDDEELSEISSNLASIYESDLLSSAA